MTRRRAIRRVRRRTKAHGLAVLLTALVVIVVLPFNLMLGRGA